MTKEHPLSNTRTRITMMRINFRCEFFFSIIIVSGILSISTIFQIRYFYSHTDKTGKFTFVPPFRANSTTSYSNDHLRNVVLTMFSTSQKDPQRDRRMPSTMDYMVNFYVTVKFLNINAIYFMTTSHQDLSAITPQVTFNLNEYLWFLIWVSTTTDF